MLNLLKKLFIKKETEVIQEDPPGRTFNQIYVGEYFGLKENNAEASLQKEAKVKKIDTIKEHALQPKFLRYIYPKNTKDFYSATAVSAYVSFQKEVQPKKWHMVHVTEISFIVRSDDFKEFEKMANVNLSKDFRELPPENSKYVYKGKDRRKKERI